MERRFDYPPTPRGDVVDELHGARVADPYRWLEADDEGVEAWTTAQNAFTRRWLDAHPGRARLRDLLDQAFDVGWVSTPSPAGPRAFWLERSGEADQPHLMVRELAAGRARVLLDVNSLSGDGTVALDWYHPSPSGRLIAYGLSSAGDERSVLHVLDVDSGEVLVDRIEGTRSGSVAWEPDEGGFHYSRFPVAPSRYWPAVTPEEATYHRQIYRHRLGADPADDVRVFGDDLPREDWPSVSRSHDGRHLVVTVSHGWTSTTVWMRSADAADDAPWRRVADRAEVRDSPVLRDDALLLFTNHEAPRGRVVRAPWDVAGEAPWEELIPEHPTRVMQEVVAVGDTLAVHWLEDASSVLTLHELDGRLRVEVPLGGIASVGGIDGAPNGDTLFYTLESYARPPAALALDLAGGAGPAVFSSAGDLDGALDLDSVEVSLERTTSADGTALTLFVVRQRGLPLDGDAPTVLYGYGGFNISLTPAYARNVLPFLADGGVYAVAHLRGGGEYGEAWHRAGMRGDKRHVFEDFEACAVHLVAAGYTRPERLAVMGGSNGGLLAGAATVHFPERFRAAVVRVPLLDMLRYHRFLIARLWIGEYGDPDQADAFAWLRAYSPYHNLPAGPAAHPAVFVLTAESDTRVHPFHARKFAAALQHRSDGRRPVLLRVETRAGHGAGKPTSKVVEEYADIWTFLYSELGVW